MIAYHGTCAENVQSILDKGFRPGTYFAYQKENALCFGGLCLFTVEFDNAPELWHGEVDWQFHIRECHGPENIRNICLVNNLLRQDNGCSLP
jgi:hypothetical protein